MTRTLVIDPKSDLPKNVQVERLLRQLTHDPRYYTGQSPLPTEVDLARTLKLSRYTIRAAMSRLVEQGLVRRQKNRGTFVIHQPVVTNLTEWSSFSAEMGRQGVQVRDFGSLATTIQPDDEVRRFFALRRATAVLQVTRIRGDVKGPIVAFESYIHPRLNLTTRSDFSTPLYQLIEKTSGVVVRRSVEQIGAIRCDDARSELLDCPKGEPLLLRTRRTFDGDGQAVEFCHCFYRADRFQMGIELLRNEP
jgi:GntR family transcriptional regulator